MDSVQFPAVLPANPFKRRVKAWGGRCLAALNPAAADRIAAGQLPPRLGLRERLILTALVDRHQRAGTLAALAPLHAWLWRGEQAVAFHAHAQERFDTLWLAHHVAIVAPLRALIEAPGSPYRQLYEIGCGSGKILEDIARRLPQLAALTGLDLSARQTERNRERAVDARIRFEAGDANDWIPLHAQAGSIFLTVAGVFEYFPVERLQLLFQHIATHCAPAVVALIEPVPQDYDFERESVSRPYNEENSLGHNYPRLLQEAGFTECFRTFQTWEGTRFLLYVAQKAWD